MTFTQEDQRDKIRSQLRYEITHPGKPRQKMADKPSDDFISPDKKKSVRARFCEKMAAQEKMSPGRI